MWCVLLYCTLKRASIRMYSLKETLKHLGKSLCIKVPAINVNAKYKCHFRRFIAFSITFAKILCKISGHSGILCIYLILLHCGALEMLRTECFQYNST